MRTRPSVSTDPSAAWLGQPDLGAVGVAGMAEVYTVRHAQSVTWDRQAQ